jgi:hypothetical protein
MLCWISYNFSDKMTAKTVNRGIAYEKRKANEHSAHRIGRPSSAEGK